MLLVLTDRYPRRRQLADAADRFPLYQMRIAPELAIVLMSGAIPLHYADPIMQLRLAGMLHKPSAMMALREQILRAVGGSVVLERED